MNKPASRMSGIKLASDKPPGGMLARRESRVLLA